MRHPILMLLVGLLAVSAAWGVLAVGSMQAEDDGSPGTYVVNTGDAEVYEGFPVTGPPMEGLLEVVAVDLDPNVEQELTLADDTCSVRRSGSVFDRNVAWSVVDVDNGREVASAPGLFRREYRLPDGDGFYFVVLVDDQERIASNSVVAICPPGQR